MGVDDVDDVAVADVARLGPLERAAVLVVEQTGLDEQGRRRRGLQQRASRRLANRPATLPVADEATTPSSSRARCSDPPRRSDASTAAWSTSSAASSKAMGTPSARRMRWMRTTSAVDSSTRSATSSGRAGETPAATSPRSGRQAAAGHLLGERQEHAWPAVQRPGGHERAPSPLAIDEPGLGESLQAHGARSSG